MLSTIEQQHATELLLLLPKFHLIALANTVINKSLSIDTGEDAIKAILLHTTSLKSLLLRQKLKKSFIFEYLHSKNIRFDGSSDKLQLIELTLTYWEEKSSQLVSAIGNYDEGEGTDEMTKVLSQQFVEWFYRRLNSHRSIGGGSHIAIDSITTDDSLTEADFWPDAAASLVIVSPYQHYEAYSAQESLALIYRLRDEWGLLLSPNTGRGGIIGKRESHGLILITVHGTIHSSAGICVGLFEQIFGLINDPTSQNNYKIKRTNLAVRNSLTDSITDS